MFKGTIMKQILMILLMILLLLILAEKDLTAKNYMVQIKGPDLGEISRLEIGEADMLIAGYWGKGVKISSNDGATWDLKNSGLSNKFINDIHVIPGAIFLATDGGGIFKTTNNGSSWFAINNGMTNLFATGIVGNNVDTLFAGTRGGGVFRSFDGGANWADANNIYEPGKRIAFQDVNLMMMTDSGRVFACMPTKGIYRSDDFGFTWTYSGDGISPQKHINEIKTDPEGNIWLATTGGGIFFSENQGDDWMQWSLEGLLDRNIETIDFQYDDLLQDYMPIVGTRKFGIWYWDPVGLTPQFRPSFMWESGIYQITRQSDGNYFAAHPYYEVVKSIGITRNDLKTWEDTDALRAQTGSLTASDDNMVYLFIEGDDIYVSEDWGNNFTPTGFGIKEVIQLRARDGEVIVITKEMDSSAPFYDGKFYRSSDKGVNWTEVAVPELVYNPQPETDTLAVEFTDTYIGGNGNYYISYGVFYKGPEDPPDGWMPVVPDLGIYRSTNGGSSWQHISLGSATMNTVALAEGLDGNIYALSNRIGVYKSTNLGVTWNNTSSFFEGERMYSIYAVGGNNVLASSANGFFLSKNEGATWEEMDLGIEDVGFGLNKRIKAIAGDGTSIVYAIGMSNNGLFQSTNGGNDWRDLNENLLLYKFNSVSSNTDGDVYATGLSTWRYFNPDNMPSPVLVSPETGAGGISIYFDDPEELEPLVMTWEDTDKADLYEIQLSKNEGFSQLIDLRVYKSTSRSFTPDLEPGHTYYWKVRSKTGDAFSKWANRFTFTTEVGAPVLIAPANDTLGQQIDTDLVWEEVGGADSYDVQIASDMEFGDVVFTASDVSSTTTASSSISHYTDYYWRARTNVGPGSSRWSDPFKFTTVVNLPSLIYPEADDIDVPVDLLFSFNGVEGADRYFIQVSKSATFSEENLLISNESDTDSTHSFILQQFYTSYWWRMASGQTELYQTGDEVDYKSEWSQSRMYTTGLAAPNMLMPEDGSIDQEIALELDLQNTLNADFYHIQLASDENFTNLFADDTLSDSQIDVSELNFITTYYWRARIIVGDLAGSWSEPWTFRTKLDIVNFDDEDCGANGVNPVLVRISWDELFGAESYEFQLSKSVLFEELIENQTGITLLSAESLELDTETIYYSRVRGRKDVSVGAWSDLCEFTTSPSSVAYEIFYDLNAKVSPNPVTDKAVLSFDFVKNAEGTLSIHDLNGNTVVTLATGMFRSGNKSYTWTPNQKLASGTYFWRLEIDEKFFTGEIKLTR